MYTVTRKNKISEKLQLCNPDGSVACELEVDLNVDQITNRTVKAYEVLGMAQNELQKSPTDPKCLEAYGNAVFAILDIIFGEAGRQKIVEFYEGNYGEMLIDLFPFINDIIGKVREASAARKAQLTAIAKQAKRL